MLSNYCQCLCVVMRLLVISLVLVHTTKTQAISADQASLTVLPGTLRISDYPTAQLQISGAASSARFGQDLLGGFIASDTPGKSLRFGTNNGTLRAWAHLTSDGLFSFSSSPTLNGEVAITTELADDVRSFIGQTYEQMHFRLSRATCPDPKHPVDPCDFSNPYAQDFLITPYRWGMAIEYPSVIEVWSQDFSVHQNHQGCSGAACQEGARFWVGDLYDNGGLFVTAFDKGPLGGPGPRSVMIAADTFAHTSHGSLRFAVRDAASDSFLFQVGPYEAETTVASIDSTGKGIFNGGLQMGGTDFAENVVVDGSTSQYEPGDLLEISDTTANSFRLITRPYSTAVMGIYSAAPGILAGSAYDAEGKVPLAIAGIVPCKVTAENGPIRPGDLLVSSATPGHAMKGTDRSQMLGAIVGKAMGTLGQGTGIIPVLVSLQ